MIEIDGSTEEIGHRDILFGSFWIISSHTNSLILHNINMYGYNEHRAGKSIRCSSDPESGFVDVPQFIQTFNMLTSNAPKLATKEHFLDDF